MNKDRKKRTMMQMRRKGAGGEGWWNPERDIVNALPLIVRRVFENYDNGIDYRKWCERHLITEEQVGEFAKAIATFVSVANKFRSFDQAVDHSGMLEFPEDVRAVILSAIGWELLQDFHAGILWIQPQDVPVITKETEMEEKRQLLHVGISKVRAFLGRLFRKQR